MDTEISFPFSPRFNRHTFLYQMKYECPEIHPKAGQICRERISKRFNRKEPISAKLKNGFIF